MTAFQYKAVDESGRTTRGVLDAADELDLDARLRGMNLDLISCRPARSAIPGFGRARVTRRDLITFCFHLEQQTRAGVPLIEGLKDLRESVDNRGLKLVTSSLVDKIEGGSSLSEAMADHPQVFDQVFVSLIRAGERSGKLVEILGTLLESLKWQDEIAAQAKKAAIYPAFTAVAIFGVVVALTVFLVPELVRFITAMNQQLPLHTRLLIATSEAIREEGHWVLLGLAAFVTAVVTLARKSEKAGLFIDYVKLHLWLVGDVYKKLVISRFTQHFALLYGAGITVLECLKICEDIVGNRIIKKAIQEAEQRIADGSNIAESFERSGLFPRLVLRMMKVGETTGELDAALVNIGYFYNRDVKDAIDKLQTMIGPVMTVSLGLVLAWVILSVLGPIYEMLTTVTM